VVGELPRRRYVVPIQGGRPGTPAHPVSPAAGFGGVLRGDPPDDGRERFRALFAQASAGVALNQLDGRFAEVNPALRELLAGTGVDLDGGRLTDLLRPLEDRVETGDESGEDGDARAHGREVAVDWRSEVAQVCAGSRPVARLELPVGPDRRLRATTALIVLGDRRYLLTHVADVTARPEADPETGPATPLERRFAVALARAGRTGLPVGILVIELDGADRLVEVLGSCGAQAVLTAVQDRLAGLLRTGDVLDRPEPDRFVVIAADVPDDVALAALVRRVEAGLAEPVDTEQARLRVTADVGAALTRPGQAPAVVIESAQRAIRSVRAVRTARHPQARVDLDSVQLALPDVPDQRSDRLVDRA
jgi:GGDEF domain-containing protein